MIAICLVLLLTISSSALALETSHIARWVHTGFHMHNKSYEDERVVLNLLENSTFEVNYIGYFEDDDDVTWEKNMEASGSYKIRENDIVFTIDVLVGTQDKEKPNYSCPFKLNKKRLILNSCELLDINVTYNFKRTDPIIFHFQ